MIVDASSTPFANEQLGRLLARTDVIETPLATEVFALVDTLQRAIRAFANSRYKNASEG
jgi:hypothetical protein